MPAKDKPKGSALRDLPGVGRVVDGLIGAGRFAESAREEITGLVRRVIERVREDLKDGRLDAAPDEDRLGEMVTEFYAARRATKMPTVVNAAGIVLHTALGRARMPAIAAQAAARVAESYCQLQYDLETGARGKRDLVVEELLCHLTGAEAATTACNNAGATMLVLAALAGGREVVVSRGHLIEIGGAFRLPDVMAQSGAVMREVGTTNKTHLRDYAGAINEQTGALCHVHPSNYQVVGFQQEVPLADLVGLGRERGLPVLRDLGSGALVDLGEFGLAKEPLVTESVAEGADVVFFSGDKLIGGPQCGVMVGKKEAIARIRKHPLARALRVGKMTLAALEATLQLFLDRERLLAEHPVYRMLSRPVAELEEAAGRAAKELDGCSGLAVKAIESQAQLGSGSLPGQLIPSRALAARHAKFDEEELARRLRAGSTPVITRRAGGEVVADLRTVLPEELDTLIAQFKGAAADA